MHERDSKIVIVDYSNKSVYFLAGVICYFILAYFTRKVDAFFTKKDMIEYIETNIEKKIIKDVPESKKEETRQSYRALIGKCFSYVKSFIYSNKKEELEDFDEISFKSAKSEFEDKEVQSLYNKMKNKLKK
jgi:hypothetical protein